MEPLEVAIEITHMEIRPPGANQGGIRPLGMPEDSHRGYALYTMPSGYTRWHEQWFTAKLALDHPDVAMEQLRHGAQMAARAIGAEARP